MLLFGCYDSNLHESGIRLNVICSDGNSVPQESALSILLVEKHDGTDEKCHKRKMDETLLQIFEEPLSTKVEKHNLIQSVKGK